MTALNEKLELAKRGNSQVAIADAHGEIGAALMDQENLPEAMAHYKDAFAVYQSVQNKLRITYNKVNRLHISWRLGDYSEAQSLFDELMTVSGP